MIETLSAWRSVQLRHESAPLLKERSTTSRTFYRRIGPQHSAKYCSILNSYRTHNEHDLATPRATGGDQYCRRVVGSLQGASSKEETIERIADYIHSNCRKWLRFHRQLETPPSNLFQPLIAEYVEAMRSARRLAPDTVFAYSSKALNFLKWLVKDTRILNWSPCWRLTVSWRANVPRAGLFGASRRIARPYDASLDMQQFEVVCSRPRFGNP